jgi:hypothetical protein
MSNVPFLLITIIFHVDITVSLTFLRSMSGHDALHLNAAFSKSQDSLKHPPRTLLGMMPHFGTFTHSRLNGSYLPGSQMIDPHSPLALYSSSCLYIVHRSRLTLVLVDGRLLVLDLLAVHLIRNKNGSTIISFHPSLNLPTTTAPFLHERIRFAGE